jgi:protein-disulfide isomerase
MNEEQTTTESTPSESTKKAGAKSSSMGVPLAIIVGAIIVAGAVYLSGGKSGGGAQVNVQGGIDQAQAPQQTPEITVLPVTADDHIRGNPNAPILIVEYSDYDCPFCKNFHETMNRIMNEYGPSGQVAWVYRHFPLEQLHPNAPKLAAASYCVSELGGDDAFWKFSDLIFGERAVNAQTNIQKLGDYAAQSGVDKNAFTTCETSGKYKEKVAQDVEKAMSAGARGTPYSIVMVGDEQGVINGAQPYDTVKQIVSNLVTQINGGTVVAE